MIRKHPFRFLFSVVGSFFVHVAAVFAMLMAVPEISPTELFRPISVSLVPESSILGTGIQLEEQTVDMGSEIPSNIATSTSPAEQTTESAEAHSRNEFIENDVQVSPEFENEFDTEPLEIVDSKLETVPEPVKIETMRTSLPEQTELSAKINESTKGRSSNNALETEKIQGLANFEERIVKVQDSQELAPTLLEERIMIEPEIANDPPVEFADSAEVASDLAHAQDTTSNDLQMRFFDEESSNISATLVLRQTKASPERAETDNEYEMIARVFPNAILDMADSQFIPPRMDNVNEVPEAPFKDVLIAPRTAIIVATIEKNQSTEIQRNGTDIESELIARIFPEAMQDVIDERPASVNIAKTMNNQEIQSIETQTLETDLLVVESDDPTHPSKPATLIATTDVEQESIAWSFPNAITDVINEHVTASNLVKSTDSQVTLSRSNQTQPTESEMAVVEYVAEYQLNESLPRRSATDVEQALIARVFPNSIQDVVEHYPTPEEVHTTIDVPEIQPVAEHTQQTNLAIVEPTEKRTVVDLADEVEVRIAYSEFDESSILENVTSKFELSENFESKVASIAEIASLQIVDENPAEIEESSSSRQVTPQNDLPQEIEPVDSQPTLAKKHVTKTETVEPELSEKSTLERTQYSDEPSITDNAAISQITQIAAIQSESEAAGSMEDTDVAPQFGVPGLSNPAPKYPYLARANNEEGQVVLSVYVDSHGNAQKVDTHKSSGFRRLDKAAKKAVQKWKFLPARTAGVVSDGIALVPVTFVLTN